MQVKKIRGIQTGVKGSVVRVDVRESGRDRPSYDSVRYQSGTRFVPNPDYRRLQARVSSAQQDVYRAQQELNRAMAKRQQTPPAAYDPNKSTISNQLSHLNQVIADGEVATAERDLRNAQSDLNSVQDALMNEPSQVEEPVFADARFPVYNLRLDGEVVISFRLIDYTTSETMQSHTVHTKDSVSDRYIAGDPGKGIADDPNELPPEHVFKEQLMNKAVEETIEKLSAEFSTYAERFFQRAKRSQQSGNQEDATEYYFRYLTAMADTSSAAAAEAEQYLQKEFGNTTILLGQE